MWKKLKPPRRGNSFWVNYEFVHGVELECLPGCYVVFGDGKLVYVGQSRNVSTRLRSYEINYARYSNTIVTPWGRFENVTVKVRYASRFGDWLMREARLIHRLQPVGNCAGTSRERTSRLSRLCLIV